LFLSSCGKAGKPCAARLVVVADLADHAISYKKRNLDQLPLTATVMGTGKQLPEIADFQLRPVVAL